MIKVIYFLYLNNFFRTCIVLSRFFCLFDEKYKDQIHLFRFLKKKKIKINKKILQIIYQPKIFIINLKINKKEILSKIYKYENLNIKNEFSYHGHKKTYQSEHNLNKTANFKKISKKLEYFVNVKISKYLNFKKLKLVRMWFVITKKSGFIKRHSHLNSDFSAVFYLKVDKFYSSNNGIKIFNNFKKIKIYEYNEKEQTFFVNEYYKKIFTFRPKVNDMIIFNSYLEHSVNNKNSKIVDRISLPFDLTFK